MNRVTLYGRIDAPPTSGQTSSGTATLNLRVMTITQLPPDRSSGASRERSDWHRVTVWGRLAEMLADKLREGAMVLVEGSLRTSSYEKDGQKRYVTDVNASSIVVCGSPQTAPARPRDEEIPF